MSRVALAAGDDLRRGAWTAEEDEKLLAYVGSHGTGHWRSVGRKAGLQRCGKSCRLRWTNYLRPNIRHGGFTPEEEDLIVKLHSSLGSRWSLIAAKMPGRTDNDIKNHWNTRLKKKLCNMGIDPVTHKPISELLRDIAAGTMDGAAAGNPMVAGDEARRCFSDNLLRKAVRDYTRTSSTAPGPSKYDSMSCATDFNLQSGSDQLGQTAADPCDVSAIAHSSLIQNEAEELHSWDHSMTSTSNCMGGQDNSCSDQDAAVELSRSSSRSPSRSFQSLANSPSRSKNNMQSFQAAVMMGDHPANCEETASCCRNFNLLSDQCLADANTPTSFHLSAAASSKDILKNTLEMGSRSSSCTDNHEHLIKELHEISRQFFPPPPASDRTSSTSSSSLVNARPALHFMPVQDAPPLPCSWPTITNGTNCSAYSLDQQAIPSTNIKQVSSCMRFNTESDFQQQLQIKRLQQSTAHFTYHPEAVTPRFDSHSPMDFKRPVPSLVHLMQQQQDHQVDVLSSSARQQFNQNPGFNLQASSSQEAPYLSLREPLSAAAYNTPAGTAAAPQLLSSFAARPAAALSSSFNAGPALISSFTSTTGPSSMSATPTGIRTAHHYDLQSPRVVLWDFQE